MLNLVNVFEKKPNKSYLLFFWMVFFIVGCRTAPDAENNSSITLPANTLNYIGTPKFPIDSSSLMFSDQGAWFAYGYPSKEKKVLGFSGPFLMTQGIGEWSSEALAKLWIPKRSKSDNLQTFAQCRRRPR